MISEYRIRMTGKSTIKPMYWMDLKGYKHFLSEKLLAEQQSLKNVGNVISLIAL